MRAEAAGIFTAAMLLYNTKVVPSAQDRMWLLPSSLPAMDGRSALIITTPFAENGAEADTLQKMMAACKLTEEQYAVIQLGADEQMSWQALSGIGAPARVLLLGIAPAQLGIAARFPAHEPVSFLGSRFLWSYALAQIAQPEIKKSLWESGLKPLFGLK